MRKASLTAGPQIRVRIGKVIFLISKSKHMFWVLKRTVSLRQVSQHLSHWSSFKIITGKCFSSNKSTILHVAYIALYKTVSEYVTRNATITHRTPSHDFVRKRQRIITATCYQEDNINNATNYFFPSEMIAKLERTQITA